MSNNQPRTRYNTSRFQSNINYDDDGLTGENNFNEEEKFDLIETDKEMFDKIAFSHDNVLKFLDYQNSLIEVMENVVSGRMDKGVYEKIDSIINEKGNFLKENLDLFRQKLLLDEALKEKKEIFVNKSLKEESKEEDMTVIKSQINSVKNVIKRRNDIQDVFQKSKEQISNNENCIKEDLTVLKYDEASLSKKIELLNQDIETTEKLNSSRIERITKLYSLLHESHNTSKEVEQTDIDMSI